MHILCAIAVAFATYSRLPVPRTDWTQENRRLALCFLPLVGCAVGGAVFLWFKLCGALSLSPLLRGAGAAALPLLLTGGIHMDGFLDTSDALASWRPPQQRLEILKDSRVGAGAVMACGTYLLLSAAVLGEVDAACAAALAPCYAASRALSAWTSVALPGARPGGMLDGFTRAAPRRAVSLAAAGTLALCGAAWAALLGLKAALPLLAAGGCALYYRRMALCDFGGVTGDLAGWLTQVSELCMLAAIVLGGKV